MTDTAHVSITGLPRLRSALRSAARDLDDLPEAHSAAAALLASAAAARAPRRTGRLAASIRPARAPGRATVTAAVPYAAPVHWGVPSRGQAAQPFLTEAATATESAWVPLYAAAVERVVADVGGHY